MVEEVAFGRGAKGGSLPLEPTFEGWIKQMYYFRQLEAFFPVLG